MNHRRTLSNPPQTRPSRDAARGSQPRAATEDDPARAARRQAEAFRQRGLELARPAVPRARAQSTRLLVVLVGHERYGIPLAQVRQVFPSLPCTPIPGAPRWLSGLANLDGQIRSVVDLRCLLGLPEPAPERANLLLLQLGTYWLGLRVDDVDRVQDVDPTQLMAPEEHADSPAASAIWGISGDGLIALRLEAVLGPALTGEQAQRLAPKRTSTSLTSGRPLTLLADPNSVGSN